MKFENKVPRRHGGGPKVEEQPMQDKDYSGKKENKAAFQKPVKDSDNASSGKGAKDTSPKKIADFIAQFISDYHLKSVKDEDEPKSEKLAEEADPSLEMKESKKKQKKEMY